MSRDELESLAAAKQTTPEKLLRLIHEQSYFETVFSNCAPLMREPLEKWIATSEGPHEIRNNPTS